MNRRELIKRLERDGCILVRHGRRHDLYKNPATGQAEAVPRHNDVKELLAKKILKSLTGE